MIKLERVSKYYNTTNNVALGLHDVSLEFEVGEIVAITGESGSGKSTLLNVIAGIDTYEDGEMYFNGEETSYYNNEDLEKYRKDNVGFIFQNYNLIDSYNVLQNVMLPLLLRGYTKNDAKARAKEIIEIVGLKNRIKNKGTHLSGGEAQRVSIARAIASDSPILACDEPTGNLDSKTGKEIMDLIKSISGNRLVLIVTHNYEEVENIATRKITLHDGEIVEDRKNKEIEKTIEEVKIIDYDVKKRDCFKIGVRNIFSTPKKTILTSLVFLVVAFIICSLIGLMAIIDKETQELDFAYGNSNIDRVVVYNEEGIDLAKIKSKFSDLEIVENSFLEDYSVNVSIDYFKEEAVFCYQDIKEDAVLYGSFPTKENEIMIGVPKTYLNSYVDYKDKELFFHALNTYWDEKEIDSFTVTGIYEYDTGTQSISLFFADNTKRDEMMGKIYLMDYGNGGYIQSGVSKINLLVDYNHENEKAVVRIPEKVFDAFENKTVYLSFSGMEKSIEKDNLIYQTSEDDIFYLTLGKNFQSEFNDNRQISIYAKNNTNVDDISKYVGGLGYDAYIPSRISRMIDFFTIFSKIIVIITSFFITIAIVSIYFLSYLVLSRIYASKNKDYTIMRTLGLRKKEMSFVVYSEICLLCISISTLVFILLKVFSRVLYGEFWSIYQYINVKTSIIYFLAILLFSLLMGRRFNRKLFKFSVNTTMKKEALDND